jgi:hypothetical protein
MKLLALILLVWLTAITFAIAVPETSPSALRLNNLTNSIEIAGELPFGSSSATTAADGNAEWARSVARGAKLLQGMKVSDNEAATLFGLGATAESQFDGDGKKAFDTWGYADYDRLNLAVDKECDFENYHKIKKTMEELGMGTKSKGKKGPNQCFVIEHWNGAAVKRNWWSGVWPAPKDQKYRICEKEYRVSYKCNMSL